MPLTGSIAGQPTPPSMHPQNFFFYQPKLCIHDSCFLIITKYLGDPVMGDLSLLRSCIGLPCGMFLTPSFFLSFPSSVTQLNQQAFITVSGGQLFATP